MKDFYVCDAAQHENKVITSSFVVASKQVKPKKSGESYLALTLVDRSGQIEAKMWDNVEECINRFEQDHFIKVKGLINKYNQRFQLTIHKLRRLEESEIDYSDYLPKTGKDIDELWRTLAEFVATFQDANLKALVESFMADPEIAAAYRTAPAAKTLHHAYIGGLLDHVVSLFRSCDLVCRNYPQVNRDLLLTGAFLHDIGKIHELAYNRTFSYTTRGQLLGHMIIELEMLNAKVREIPGFPEDLKLLIEHLVISHHGHYEFGSPKLPMFPEALMLHYLDDLDSKMESMRAHFEREAALDSPWTGYNSSLGRPLLNTAKFLGKGISSETPAEPEQASGNGGEQEAAATQPATAGEATGTASPGNNGTGQTPRLPGLEPSSAPAAPVKEEITPATRR
jgi:3'-5' exoribonuclease